MTARVWQLGHGLVAILLAMALGGGAVAQGVPASDLAARAAKRFPQPVLVGDLVGRAVLKPIEAQPVLGHVVAVVRRADGGIDLVVTAGGLLGVGGRPVAVPSEAVGLLGEHVALLDVTPDQLVALPTADAGAGALGPAETVRVGLAKPFH